MPSGPVAHISFLVNDLDKAIADWSTILGVLDPKQVEKRIVRYNDIDGGGDRMSWATFVSDHGVEIQLMQPDPDSGLGRRLAKRGEHIHHICLTTADLEGSLQTLKSKGVDVIGGINMDPEMPWQQWGWVGPKSAHGVLIEVAKPYESHNDGKWHPASA
jgi:methylmalonyl-CoA/ethylmalonyl-CoA epimerase